MSEAPQEKEHEGWDRTYRLVRLHRALWPRLVEYASKEGINIELAINQFVRDGLEGA